jgi:uncharacterized protein YkwD
MSLHARRLTAAVIAAFIVVAAVGSSPGPAAAADMTIGRAELEMFQLINIQRRSAGLVDMRLDSRLMSIARARSTDMATKHYFSHTSPSGETAFSLIQNAGITWYGAGEILVWNTYPTLWDSAIAARDGWLGSPAHREVMMSSGYNYMGIGLAIDPSNGAKIWTGVSIKGPDRTGGWTSFTGTSSSLASESTYRTVRVYWTGGDIRLMVLTAGFRRFQVQRRTDLGAWVWVSTSTTATSRALNVYRGHRYDLRVRSCDQASNCGMWKTKTVWG